jgi:hypothetical protein
MYDDRTLLANLSSSMIVALSCNADVVLTAIDDTGVVIGEIVRPMPVLQVCNEDGNKLARNMVLWSGVGKSRKRKRGYHDQRVKLTPCLTTWQSGYERSRHLPTLRSRED